MQAVVASVPRLLPARSGSSPPRSGCAITMTDSLPDRGNYGAVAGWTAECAPNDMRDVPGGPAERAAPVPGAGRELQRPVLLLSPSGVRRKRPGYHRIGRRTARQPPWWSEELWST
nr:hypothetical protein StreXyl84_52870 [Streptomyces sp. Xyl84]